MEKTTSMTRRERRAGRQRGFVMAKEACLAARSAHLECQAAGEGGGLREVHYEACLPGWLRPLDYKVSGETGALKVPSKVRTWHLGDRVNGHAPPPGQGWDRSGPTYVTGICEVRFAKPIIHHRWRRLRAQKAQPAQTHRRRRPGHGWLRKQGRQLYTVAFLRKEHR